MEVERDIVADKQEWIAQLFRQACSEEPIAAIVVRLLSRATTQAGEKDIDISKLAADFERILKRLRSVWYNVIHDNIDIIPASWDNYDENFF